MITIYDTSDNAILTIPVNDNDKYVRELMGDHHVTIEFNTARPITLKKGYYVTLFDIKLSILTLSLPTRGDKGFTYSQQFDAPEIKWKNDLFFFDKNSTEASWTVTGKLTDFLILIASNLKSLGYKCNGLNYVCQILGTFPKINEIYSISFSGAYVFDAMSDLANKWEIEWWVEGNIIYFGLCEKGTLLNLTDGVELSNITMENSSGTHCTRLYAFGSDRNIPSYYRKKLMSLATDSCVLGEVDQNLLDSRNASVAFNESMLYATQSNDQISNIASDTSFTSDEKSGALTLWNKITSELSGIDAQADKYKIARTDYDAAFQTLANYLNAGTTWSSGIPTWLSSSETTTIVSATFISTWGNYYSARNAILLLIDQAAGKISDASQIAVNYRNRLITIYGSSSTYASIKANQYAAYEAIYLKCNSFQPDVDAFKLYVEDYTNLTITFKSGTLTGKRNGTAINEDLTGKTWNVQFLSYLSEKYFMLIDGNQYSDISIANGVFDINDPVLSKINGQYLVSPNRYSVVYDSQKDRLRLPEGTNYIDAWENLSDADRVDYVKTFDDIYPNQKSTVSEVIVSDTGKETVTNDDSATYVRYYNEYTIKTSTTYLSKYKLEGYTPKIHFNTGDLAGLDFDMTVNYDGNDMVTALSFKIVANTDLTVRYPNDSSHPRVGDEFVWYNIDTSFMTGQLTTDAEKLLLTTATEWLQKNIIDDAYYSCPTNKVNCKANDIFLGLGQKVQLISSAFNINRESRIYGFEININNKYNAIYKVSKSAKYSHLSDIEDKVDATVFVGATSAGNSSSLSDVSIISSDSLVTATDKNVFSSLRAIKEIFTRAISKTEDDSVGGFITFVKGLCSKVLSTFEKGIKVLGGIITDTLNVSDKATTKSLSVSDQAVIDKIVSSIFSSGQLGSGFTLYAKDGKSYMEVDELLVRVKAIFTSLEVRKLSYVGDNLLMSSAGCKIGKVEETGTTYKCYFLADDGTTATTNDFVVGDQARCQTFNIKAGKYTNVSNKYYWRLVTAVGDDYIELSKTDCDTNSDVPAAGDALVQLGNRTDTSRQNAMMFVITGENAPSFIQYKAIAGYTLSGKDQTMISPSGNKFTGSFNLSTGYSVLDYADNAANQAKKDAQGYADIQVSNVQVGGRNHVVGTSSSWCDGIALSDIVNNTTYWKTIKLDGFQVGDVICISFDYKYENFVKTGTGTASLYFQGSGDVTGWNNGAFPGTNFLNLIDFNSKSGTIHVSYFYTLTSADLQNTTWTSMVRSDYITGTEYIKNYQIKKGTKEPDWSPAPEDLDANAQNYANSAEGRAKEYTNTTFEAVPDKITLAVSTIQIGGRNLLLGTKDFSGSSEVSFLTSDTYLGFKIIHASYGGSSCLDICYWNSRITPKANQYYTLSFYCKGSGNIYSYFYPDCCVENYSIDGYKSTASDGQTITTLTSEWRRVWIVFKTGNVSGSKNVLPMRLVNGTEGYICGVKFEEGNKPTDCTPAPEDIDASIAQRPTTVEIKSSLTLSTEGISLLGKTISLAGVVTFNSLDTDSQNRIINAANTANTAYNQVNWQYYDSTVDLNNMTTTGKYMMRGTLTNTPVTAWAYLVVEHVDSDRVTQTIWHDTDATNKYTRSYYGGSWSGWSKIANAGDVNAAQSTANNAQSNLDSLKNSLKGLAFTDKALDAMRNEGIIAGAYMNMSYLDVKTIVANGINAQVIDANYATFRNLNVENATLKNVQISGSMRSPFLWTNLHQNQYELRDNIAMNNTMNMTITASLDRVGKRVTVSMVRDSNGNYIDGTSYIAIQGNLPIYEDGIAHSQISISREIVELLGYGTDTQLFGFIVLNRKNVYTAHKYGYQHLVMYEGYVNDDGSMYKYKSFDGQAVSSIQTGDGYYRVNIPSTPVNEYLVLMGNYSHISGAGRYASVYNRQPTYFEVYTGDDSTSNTAPFYFQVISTADWS